MKLNWIFFPIDWILLFKHSWIKKKLQPFEVELLDPAVPKLFWALPKPEFGEHASNNDPSPKQRIVAATRWRHM